VLALLGPARFASVGVPEEPGTVLLSVSGSAKHPAVVECPTGIPLGAVLDICQAPAGDGVLVGGYHGMWLDAEAAYQVPVGREGLAAAGGTFGSGIVLPLGDGTCPLGEVSRIANYLAGESAGQCGPCKLGLPSIARALAAIVDGSGGIEALDVARRAAATVNGRGACSHPDGTTRFVLSALEVFTEDLAAHVFHSSCGRPVRGILPLPDGPETADAKQLIVDWVRCEGHGLCAHLVPEFIHLDKTGYPVIMPIPVPPWLERDAQQAVDMCPALALRLAADPKKRNAKGGQAATPMPVPAPTLRTGSSGRLALAEAGGGVGSQRGTFGIIGRGERGGHGPAGCPPPRGAHRLTRVDEQTAPYRDVRRPRIDRRELRPGGDHEHRVRLVRGGYRAVGVAEVRERHQGVAGRLRVVHHDLRPEAGETVGDIEARGVAHVVGAWLERGTPERDPLARQRT
jgi:ferredoxin